MFCEEEILDGSVKTITKTMFLALRSALRPPPIVMDSMANEMETQAKYTESSVLHGSTCFHPDT